MSSKLNSFKLMISSNFIKNIRFYPQKSNYLQNRLEKYSKIDFSKTSNTEDKNKLRISLPPSNCKPKKNLSPKNKEKEYLTIFSPNSKTKISYLNHFNNNSIYYSNHKNNNFKAIYNKNNYLKTEPKLSSQKNNGKNIYNNFNNNKISFIKKPLDKNIKINGYNQKRNKNENSKNNYIDENKKIILLNFYNYTIKKDKQKLELNTTFKDVKKENEINCEPKRKNLSYIISPKKLFGIKNKENQIITINTSREKNKIFPEVINPDEYTKINQIGQGSFGKIFRVKWNKNNNYYAMKEMNFQTEDNILYLKSRVKFINNFVEKTNCNGLIKIYGDYSHKKGNLYYYYEVMELGHRDWEKEIKTRKSTLNYYNEKELFDIMKQLIKTLSLMQQNHITHRDIKLQNILLVQNKFKICDFGESRTLNQKGIIVQPVRGSELYMSPILFFGLNKKINQVMHNTYKSDVFSLGMCILFAANLSDSILYDIRELTNMDDIRNILKGYLSERYSIDFIEILLCMLQFNEKKRPDFIQLENLISQCLSYN